MSRKFRVSLVLKNRYSMLKLFPHVSQYNFTLNPTNNENSQNSKVKQWYKVTRVDDNDHKFTIKTFDNIHDANKFKEQMEQTKHKQHYFVEPLN